MRVGREGCGALDDRDCGHVSARKYINVDVAKSGGALSSAGADWHLPVSRGIKDTEGSSGEAVQGGFSA